MTRYEFGIVSSRDGVRVRPLPCGCLSLTMVSDRRLCLKEGGPTTVAEARGGGLMEAVTDGAIKDDNDSEKLQLQV
jgi:hypothetical protein